MRMLWWICGVQTQDQKRTHPRDNKSGVGFQTDHGETIELVRACDEERWRTQPTDERVNDGYTVEPVLGDYPFCLAKAVSQDKWSLTAGRTKIMFYHCVHFYRQPGSRPKWEGHSTVLRLVWPSILLLFIEWWRHLADSNEPNLINKSIFYLIRSVGHHQNLTHCWHHGTRHTCKVCADQYGDMSSDGHKKH